MGTTARSPRRKILYLSATLVPLIAVMVIAWTLNPDLWGLWSFLVIPAAIVTGIRLIVAFALCFPRSR